MQARPITTLAAEYRETIVDDTHEWQFAVRRPYSLMETSVWSHWIDAEHARETFGVSADSVLAIQDEADVTGVLFPAHVFEKATKRLMMLFNKDREQLLAILRHGREVYHDAQARFESDTLPDLDVACELFIKCLHYTAAVPILVLTGCASEGLDDPEISGICNELRSQSVIPVVERKFIEPIVAGIARDLGFSAAEQAARVCTWRELREGWLDQETLDARWQAVQRGDRFVFQYGPNGESVRFVSQGGYLLMRAMGRRQAPAVKADDELHGQSAWPGVHRGRARVILTPDAVGQTIEEGEVLVSIQSSPALMPLLVRCGAIVTDDGGVACHASIICRELKIPTIIGTETATSTIQTGDFVEVDAYAQVVRILERGSG